MMALPFCRDHCATIHANPVRQHARPHHLITAPNTAGRDNAMGACSDDPRLALLLGLCPAVAVTNSLGIGLALGLGTLLVLCGTSVLGSVLRSSIPSGMRLAIVLLVIAAVVTVAELVCKAFLFDLYLLAGIFLPLIVANGTLLTRTLTDASAPPLWDALLEGLRHGIGSALLLIVIGGLRQSLGGVFALTLLPAGAFFAVALIVAARNAVVAR